MPVFSLFYSRAITFQRISLLLHPSSVILHSINSSILLNIPYSLWRRTLASSFIFCLNDYLPCALNIRVSRIWMRLWKCDARVQQLRVNIVREDAITQVYRLMYASISVHLVFTCGGGIKYRIIERQWALNVMLYSCTMETLNDAFGNGAWGKNAKEQNK